MPSRRIAEHGNRYRSGCIELWAILPESEANGREQRLCPLPPIKKKFTYRLKEEEEVGAAGASL